MVLFESRLHPEGSEVNLPGVGPALLLARSAERKGAQGTYLIEREGRRFVYKVYGARRNPVKAVADHTISFLEGRSSPAPSARRDTERCALRLWREHGFPVFHEIESAPAIAFGAPVLTLEYVPGRRMDHCFLDPDIAREAKLEMVGKLAHDWARRHELAERLAEPMLIHEHPGLTHIWLGDDGQHYYFDFEVAFTRRASVRHLIAREILRLVRSVLKIASDEEREDLLDVILKNYRHTEFLRLAAYDLWAPRRFAVRIFRWFEHRTPRNRRPFSKFETAQWIVARLPRGLNKKAER